MMQIIKATSKEEIPKNIFSQLKRLNFNSAKGKEFGTYMYFQLEKFELYGVPSQIYYMMNEDKVACWCIIQRYKNRNELCIFTRSTMRRKGYARALLEHVKNDNQNIKLYLMPHDKASTWLYTTSFEDKSITASSRRKLDQLYWSYSR